MNTTEVLEHYTKLQSIIPSMKLPLMENTTFHLEVQSTLLLDEDEVIKQIQACNPTSAWLGYQSGNQHFHNNDLDISTTNGILMNAEVTNQSGETIHVRYNGSNGWIVTQYQYAEGIDYVADTVKHLASFDQDANVTLNYLRFWKASGNELGINPVFSCFTGFGER